MTSEAYIKSLVLERNVETYKIQGYKQNTKGLA